VAGAGGLDWDAIARGAPVLVLYMASQHLPSIAERLMSSGRRPDEPVAIISKATTPAQRVLVSNLGEVATGADAETIEAPAIIVVGEVVRLRAALDWVALQGRLCRAMYRREDEPAAALLQSIQSMTLEKLADRGLVIGR
jgi:uroporphyrin-III C-methyltransferase